MTAADGAGSFDPGATAVSDVLLSAFTHWLTLSIWQADLTALTPEQQKILGSFRADLEKGKYLEPGETLGTDDATLL